MTALLRNQARVAGQKLVISLALGLIGLFVGVGCVMLPIGIPLGTITIAALLLLWVMPDIRSVPTAWMSTMLVPFTIVLLCVPTFFGLILPGLPWISVRRAASFAWVLPFCIILAGSSESRAYIYSSFAFSPGIRACVVGFCLVVLLSLLTSVAPSISITYAINFSLNCIIPMLILVYIMRSEKDFILFFWVAIFCIGIDFIIGAIEFRLQRPFLIYILPGWMRDQILAANPTAVLTLFNGLGTRGGMYRASSTYTTPLSWGEVSAMLLPMCLHFIAYGKTFFQRCYGVIGIVLCFLSVILSGSRGAYVGMIAATIAYCITWSVHTWARHPNRLAGGISLFLFAVLSITTLLAVLFVGRVRTIVLGGSETQNSTDARALQWDLAKPKILARPLLGYGPGTAGDVVHYTSPGGFLTIDGFHMNLLVDYGIPGFVFFFSIFMVSAYYCFQTYIAGNTRDATLGATFGASILAFVMYRFTLSQIDSLPLAFMLVGFAVAYRRLNLQSRHQATRPICQGNADSDEHLKLSMIHRGPYVRVLERRSPTSF